MTANSLGDFLGRLAAHLRQAGIPHMVAGSVASSAHGEPRSTQDLDIVIEPTLSTLHAFLAEIPDHELYVSKEAALEALRERRQFNVIDLETGWKADLIIRKNRPFSRTEFARRQDTVLLGVETQIASAEDVILTKLEWAIRSGESERQLRDVRGILAMQSDLDDAYLDTWATTLGVSDLLDRARSPE